MGAGLPATRPSFPGVGNVQQVYDLSTNLPADKAGIDLAALQTAQMTAVDATQLSKLKGFSFSYVMFKEISLLCDISTGVPQNLGLQVRSTRDRGQGPRDQFTGKLWSTMCKKLHISHRTMAAYHPEANGIIKRVHRSLKATLQAKRQSTSWSSELPLILLGLRSAPQESDAVLSFERTFGVPPILTGEFWESAETPNQDFLTDFQRAIEVNTSPRTLPNRTVTPAVPDDLFTCKFVFV